MMVAALAVVAGVFVGPVPGANAEGIEGTTSADARRDWGCWAADGDNDYVTVGCYDLGNSSTQFSADFREYGEHLDVYDCFNNNRRTVAYLDILDTPNVDYTRTNNRCNSSPDFNFSISDGTRISLMVCSSTASGSQCSPRAYTTA
jgi:hypothetical protein